MPSFGFMSGVATDIFLMISASACGNLLSHFSKSVQMLLILGAKDLLTGTTVIAKTMISEVLKTETMKKT